MRSTLWLGAPPLRGSRRVLVPALLLLALLGLVAAPPAPAQEPDPVVAQARALSAEGNHEQAIAALQEALEKRPGDATLLLELGRAHRARADEVLRSESPAFGRLALLDAQKAFRQALEARPDWPEALRELGATAIVGSDWEAAVAAYGRAAEVDPADGESRYQLGYALAYLRRFHEAIGAFEAAERIRGPEPRILLNLGISQASMPDPDGAQTTLGRLLEGEIAAGRPASWYANRAVLWLWRVFAGDRRYDAAERVFLDLAERHPDLSAAHWYLGWARWEQGKLVEAVAPFQEVVRLAPDFAEGRSQLVRSLAAAGRFDAAVAALDAYRERVGAGQDTLALLIEVADRMAGGGKGREAIALLARHEETFPDDPDLVQRKGELLYRAGRFEEAFRELTRAAELGPLPETATVLAQKAATAWMRTGGAPAGLRPEVEPVEPGEGGVLFDFEESRVFARLNGATGAVEEGIFRIERTGDAGSLANLTLTIIPTLDTRPFMSIRFRARGLGGETLLLMAKDCYDEFGPTWTRLWFRESVKLDGTWQVFTLSLDGFETPGERKIPFERARLRAVIFEMGVPRAEGDRPGSLLFLDDVALVGEAGDLPLASFDEPEDPTLFLSGGEGASAFVPTLFTEEQVRDYRPDPNTYVTAAILRDGFSPGMVHGGNGSFRLALTRPAEAYGELTLSDERAARAADASALVFWARGAKGGERVRILLRDALDEGLGNARPASAPRMEAGGTLLEGRFVLAPEWRRYVISRSAFPDVDFGKLRSIRLEFGAAEGNPEGTSFLVDDIGWE